PKKIAGLEEPATRLKVEAIVILKSAHRLEDLLVAAGLARSTFFYHQKRLAAPDKHAGLKQAIRDSFQRNKHRYGYRRVLLDLRKQGWVVNHKLVYKLMNQLGLKSKVRVKSTTRTKALPATSQPTCSTDVSPRRHKTGCGQVMLRSFGLLAPRSTCRRSWISMIVRSCRTACLLHRARR